MGRRRYVGAAVALTLLVGGCAGETRDAPSAGTAATTSSPAISDSSASSPATDAPSTTSTLLARDQPDGSLALVQAGRDSADAAATTAGGGVDGPVVYAAPSSSGLGEEAAADGVLVLIDGCLLLADSIDASRRWNLVWAAGTRWDPVAGAVILPDGTPAPIGTAIGAGGGYHPAGGISRFLADPDALSTVARCAADGNSDGVFVIQHPVEIDPQP